MNLLLKTITVAILFTVLGCGEFRDGAIDGGGTSSISGGASIQTQVKKTYFIDGTTKSCVARAADAATTDPVADDVSPFYFRLAGVRIPPAPVGFRYRIAYIRVTLQGLLDGSPTCTISSDELTELVTGATTANDPLFISAWRSDPLGNVIPGSDEVAALPANQQFIAFDCPITCGGVTIPDTLKGTQFTVQAKLEAVGALYPVSNTFDERPFRSETTFSIEYF